MRNSQWIALVFGLALYSSAQAADAPDLGKQTYEKACVTCHTPTMAAALKSPAVHDQAAWDVRFAAAEQAAKQDPTTYPQAIDFLVAQVKKGKGAMAAGGACTDCTDEAYKAAILFMRNKE
jgi:cytochrome c5